MIAGEELWLDQSLYTEQEYDEFFKKIRKKIKRKIQKVSPPRIFRPFGGFTIGSKLLQPQKLLGVIKPVRPKAPQITPQVAKAVQFNKAQEVQLAEERTMLMQDIAAFEKKKAEDMMVIEDKKVQVEQTELDAKQGSNQQLMIYGGLGVLSVIVVLALVARQSSRQSQLNALAALTPVNS